MCHIDFGIVFEQGKTLTTPETVPFRLTRDVVDGLGVTGTKGLFTKSCEEVLGVLRGNVGALVTILEVFLHDPLYRFMLSPVMARLKQREDGGGGGEGGGGGGGGGGVGDGEGDGEGEVANRTLTKIKQKLNGFEDGGGATGESMGVSAQVQLLVSEATSTDNLSKLFQGWAPWV